MGVFFMHFKSFITGTTSLGDLNPEIPEYAHDPNHPETEVATGVGLTPYTCRPTCEAVGLQIIFATYFTITLEFLYLLSYESSFPQVSTTSWKFF